jgi:hypothetical protein
VQRLDEVEKRKQAANVLDDIRFLKDAIKDRKDGISPFNIPGIRDEQRIAKAFAAVFTYAPKTTIDFLKELEEVVKPVSDFENRMKGADALAGKPAEPPPLPE